MQSFRAIRPTTNPYIAMLDAALAASPELVHLRFSWRRALFGAYDAIHFHWPETLLGGAHWWTSLAKRGLFTLLVLRLALGRIAVVRTLHNLALPEGIGWWQRALLTRVLRQTTLQITLNASTPVRDGRPSVLIPHGHYRDWFADLPREEPVPGRLAFVGLIRRYKGVEDLLAAFTGLQPTAPGASLEIGGMPSSPELRRMLLDAAEANPSIVVHPSFLADRELVEIVTRAELVVLPYRMMHNSGTTLAALSLDRPVLVPDNAVNRALSEEVGDGWVHLFAATLTPAALAAATAAVRAPRSQRPTLADREWTEVAERHAEAYHRAVAFRRSPSAARLR